MIHDKAVIQPGGLRSSPQGLILWKGALRGAGPQKTTTTTERKKIVMKLNILAVVAIASLMAVGTSFAQGGPRGQGKGYGCPPASDAERAARQAACLEQNGGVCPQDGVCAPGKGKGKGQGQGNGQRKGLRDGTGPRSADGTCPEGNVPQQRGRRQ
jgi:hypothetical protein